MRVNIKLPALLATLILMTNLYETYLLSRAISIIVFLQNMVAYYFYAIIFITASEIQRGTFPQIMPVPS